MEGHSKLKISVTPFRGRKVEVIRPLNALPKISLIFGMGRPTNFKLGIHMGYHDTHRRCARWTQRSKVKIITSCRQF